MARGGARNRSGPAKDESSARSEQVGYSLTALPAEGFRGDVPDFPLQKRIIWNEYYVGDGKDREKIRENDTAATEQVWERELDLWAWLWTTPQACAWSMPSERWRLHTIAMYVRTFVLCESSEATAADKGSVHRFADQIGMTPAGLKENGWKIAEDELGKRRAERGSAEVPEDEDHSPRLRDAE